MKGGTGVVAKWLADVDYMIFASSVERPQLIWASTEISRFHFLASVN